MAESAKIPLLVREEEAHGWPDDRPASLPITRAAPLWRARRGYLIHRPLRGMIYPRWQTGSFVLGPYTHMAWLCGNSSNEPIPVKPECMDGLRPCRRCGVEQPEKG